MQETHHAYLYLGSDTAVLPLSVQQPSIDVLHYSSQRWGINDTRQLIAAAAQRPVAGPQHSFVVVAAELTNEAQNALLKLLEDPPPGAVFYLVVPSLDRLLPTVHSRLALVSAPAPLSVSAVWDEFCALSLPDQLTEIAERAKIKDVTWQQAILTAAVQQTVLPQSVRVLVDSNRARAGVSRKMLLEEVALSLASQ